MCHMCEEIPSTYTFPFRCSGFDFTDGFGNLYDDGKDPWMSVQFDGASVYIPVGGISEGSHVSWMWGAEILAFVWHITPRSAGQLYGIVYAVAFSIWSIGAGHILLLADYSVFGHVRNPMWIILKTGYSVTFGMRGMTKGGPSPARQPSTERSSAGHSIHFT